MDRICEWRDVWKEDLERVEDPFFACSVVQRALLENTTLRGLCDFRKACDFPLGRPLLQDDIWRALKLVEDGRWLLIREQPFSPIDVSRYPRLRWAESKLDLLLSESKYPEVDGPGKWKTFSIDTDLLWSGVALAANFLTSRGDEGRLFSSEGKDYANTRRLVSQRWVPLGEKERSFARLSAIHRYGDVRRITQNYVQADDAWAITGESWHWRPVVPDEEYEYRRGAY